MRAIAGPSQPRQIWQEVPAGWFQWETIISVPWRDADSHINVCESRARNLTLRWRARDARLHNLRFLNLLDSQVNLSTAARGRTSSHGLRHIDLRSNAVLLASHMREICGYTRSDRNPADAPSRDLEEWSRHRERFRRAHVAKANLEHPVQTGQTASASKGPELTVAAARAAP